MSTPNYTHPTSPCNHITYFLCHICYHVLAQQDSSKVRISQQWGVRSPLQDPSFTSTELRIHSITQRLFKEEESNYPLLLHLVGSSISQRMLKTFQSKGLSVQQQIALLTLHCLAFSDVEAHRVFIFVLPICLFFNIKNQEKIIKKSE